MKIHFFGAAGEVTGSCYLVEAQNTKILIDCGVFQGVQAADERNHEPLPFDPTTLDAVIVTHAHIDHCGRVPMLVQRGYRGPIYATEPTAALLRLQWEDMLEIMRSDFARTQRAPLYEEADVEKAENLCRGFNYYKEVVVAPDVSFVFHDAGHIFGSAFVELKAHGHTAVFSGDIGNDHVPILRNTDALVACDILVCEATYGDRLHAPARQRRDDLRRVIVEALQRGGALMIAAFSIERTQEILFEMDQLIEHERALPRVPVYLDSPLAIRANDVYKKFPEYYDVEAAAEWKAGDDFLDFPGLHSTLSVGESKRINSAPNPKIIIAGSGMLSGGRITHHLLRYMPDPKSTLLMVSYQAEGTLGRKIQDHAPQVTINGEPVPVRCHIERIDSYSAHGDQNKLLQWVQSGPTRPKQVVVVHSDPPAAAEFVGLLSGQVGLAASAARLGQVVEI